MKKLKVMTVVGTRPEIIRLSRVMEALDRSEAIEHIIVQGKKIIVKINDKIINEYTEGENGRLSGGTIALQGHDPKSKVYYKEVMIKILPD